MGRRGGLSGTRIAQGEALAQRVVGSAVPDLVSPCPHLDVCVLRDGDDRILGVSAQGRPQLGLRHVPVTDGKAHGLAVVFQNEVLAYFQPVPPIWPQGARFCAGNGPSVNSG